MHGIQTHIAFFTDNNKMWDLPCDFQQQITGGLVLMVYSENIFPLTQNSTNINL